MGLQSFFPAEDKGEEESQTSRDGKYFSPDPLEAPLDGSRAGAARAAKLAGDSSVPRPCREPLPAAADSLLGRANLFLLGDRCQHLPSPLCCSPGSDIRLSVCLSAHSQLPRGVHGAKPGFAPSPGRTPRSVSAPRAHKPSRERIPKTSGERRGQASPPGPCHPATTSCSRGDLGMLKPSRLLQSEESQTGTCTETPGRCCSSSGLAGGDRRGAAPLPSLLHRREASPPEMFSFPRLGFLRSAASRQNPPLPARADPAPRCPWRRLCVGREQEHRVPVASQPNTSAGMGAAPGQPCKTAARDKTHAGNRPCPQPKQPGQRGEHHRSPGSRSRISSRLFYTKHSPEQRRVRAARSKEMQTRA